MQLYSTLIISNKVKGKKVTYDECLHCNWRLPRFLRPLVLLESGVVSVVVDVGSFNDVVEVEVDSPIKVVFVVSAVDFAVVLIVVALAAVGHVEHVFGNAEII